MGVNGAPLHHAAPARLGLVYVAFAIAAVAFVVAVASVLVDGQLWLVSGPIALGLVAIASVLLVALVVADGVRMSAVLLVAVFLVLDISLRPSGEGGFDPLLLAKAALYGVLFLCAVVHGSRQALSHPLLALYVLYSVLTLLTAFYSPAPLLAISGGVTLVGIFGAAAILAGEPRERLVAIWRWMFVGLAVIAAASLAAYVLAPGIGIAQGIAGSGRLRGITGHPNSVGPLMAFGLLLAVYLRRLRATGLPALVLVAGGALMLVTLALSDSRAAFVSLLAAIPVAAALARPKLVWLGAILGVAFAWLALSGALGGLEAWLAAKISRSGGLGEVYSLTGRTAIWTFSYEKWLESPWMGYGLASPRFVIPDGWANFWGGTTTTAHNLLLESLLSVGAIGTGLLAACIAWLGLGLMRLAFGQTQAGLRDRTLLHLAVIVVLLVLVDGLVEKSVGGMPHPYTVLLALALATYVSLMRGPQA
jgi:O-antigen ligase